MTDQEKATMKTYREIEKAADRVHTSRGEMDRLIYDARTKGLPLRGIAKAAGMSYETVRRIAERQQ